MSQLIDTTEMYLKTVYELYEDHIPALRARIVERLEQSGPTVSETVQRMERDKLVTMSENRHIQFTRLGYSNAVRVMRRHRLCERLLHDVIGMDWTKIHNEACRWEHVVSEEAVDLIADLLKHPSTDLFGNPIPAIDHGDTSVVPAPGRSLAECGETGDPVTVLRIGERAQVKPAVLAALHAARVLPGEQITVRECTSESVTIEGVSAVTVPCDCARSLFVRDDED